jgi:hypothetical protein
MLTLATIGGRPHRAESECEAAETGARPPEPNGVLHHGLQTTASSVLQDETGRIEAALLLVADRDGCPVAQGLSKKEASSLHAPVSPPDGFRGN